jgi:hypothetical protein
MDQDPRDHDDAVEVGEAEDGPLTVPDEDLPEDLQPSEDNPLAVPADDDVPDDILTQGAGHDDSGESPEDDSASGTDGA